jgi:hypothetical protein
LQRQTRGEQGPLVDTKHICRYCMALWPVLNEIISPATNLNNAT